MTRVGLAPPPGLDVFGGGELGGDLEGSCGGAVWVR